MNKTMSARSFIALVGVSLAVPAAADAQVTLKVGDAEGSGGSEVVVPILISGSRNVGPMQFVLDYDRRILEAIPDPPGAEPRAVVFGDIGDGGMISHNASAPGEVGIALRTDEPIARDGELLHVRFLVTGEKGDMAVISIAAAAAWEKESLAEVPVVTEPGPFAVVGGFGLLVPLIAGAIGLLLALT